jgi:predicted Zn-dependent protease
VINADVLNAFALLGGYVFVFRGLIEKSPSEAAFLGVLDHEWAHVTARHGTRGMTRTIKTLAVAVSVALATTVWAEVTEDKVQKLVLPLIGAGTLAGAQLRLLSKGREQELEADRLGSQYALLVNYHPRGIGDMFENFKREKGGGSSTLEEYLATHPNYDTRIGRNYVLAALFYPSKADYVTNSRGYEHALAALTGELLPPAAQSAQVAKSFVAGI